MAKPKGWIESNKEFLQPPKNPCMAAVGWEVGLEFYADRDDKGKKNGKYNASVQAELSITDEAKNHYVNRKADLRPLRKMRKELDDFEDACIKALFEKEKYNAKSKEST